jgi:serine acetyltransferase
MNKPLVFLGSNANIWMFLETAERQGYKVAGIMDKDYFGNTQQLFDIPIIASELDFDDPDKLFWWKNNYNFFICVNWSSDKVHTRDKQKRRYLIDLVRKHNIEIQNIVDPTAYVSRFTKLGQGIYIGPLVSIEPDCEIHDFVQIYNQVGLGHGSIVGENSILQRGVTCTAHIGKDTYLSMWAKAFHPDTVKIGNNVTINPGLYVARDVADGEVIKLSKDSIRVYQFMSNPDVYKESYRDEHVVEKATN